MEVCSIVRREEVKKSKRSQTEELICERRKRQRSEGGGHEAALYVPPSKLASELGHKISSPEHHQKLTWNALRKSITGLINKVNTTNIKNVIPELFRENLIRGRGLLARSVIRSQLASPAFTDVFAALVAVINTKFPQIGSLVLRRLVLQMRRAYKRYEKPQLLASVKFLAHLVNQRVAHEIVALELLALLLDQPTADGVEVATALVTECGAALESLAPKALGIVFERFRAVLHQGEIDKRVQFLIEGLFAIRRAKFRDYPAIRPELDLVEIEDQLTHEVSIMDEDVDQDISLDVFKPDPDYYENEKRYQRRMDSILDGGEDLEASSSDQESDESEDAMEIKDQSEIDLVNLRRAIYLTIMSSLHFEEAGHKLLKIQLEPGQEMELCTMLLECCSQEKTYRHYYGLLAQRLCTINKLHRDNFESCFIQHYSTIHRLETSKLRNVATFFAHLLSTNALPWNMLDYISLTEEDTTSSSRIFIKILFQQLSEHLGVPLLKQRLDECSFEPVLPKSNPRNTRFAINFFTSIGLGGLTQDLRHHLKKMSTL